jgi:tRNA(Ile)-lysidine synthase
MHDTLNQTIERFILRHIFPDAQDSGVRAIAVGCSGGPDSMALLQTLSDWSVSNENLRIHAVIVDHRLRTNSTAEAHRVRDTIKTYMPHVVVSVQDWMHDGIESRLQEQARTARYDILTAYCKHHNIRYLFTAHHRDDQAETFLMRLAAGSGLDGLAGMAEYSSIPDGLNICRPFLTHEKKELEAHCVQHGIPYVQDPSNEKSVFARVRLRQAQDILAAEGLTGKRLSVTAARLGRARAALEHIAQETYEKHLMRTEQTGNATPHKIILNSRFLNDTPEDISLRVVMRAIRTLRTEEAYLPRMEKIEALHRDLCAPAPFRTRTLGGLLFKRKDKATELTIAREDAP